MDSTAAAKVDALEYRFYELMAKKRFAEATVLLEGSLFSDVEQMMEDSIAEKMQTMVDYMKRVLLYEHSMHKFFAAAKKGRLDTVKKELEEGLLTIHSRDCTGKTALHWACVGAQPSVVQYLAGIGANVNTKDKHNKHALHDAVGSRSKRCVQVLLEHGADANVIDDILCTPLHWAAHMGKCVSIAGELISAGADVHMVDKRKNQASKYAHRTEKYAYYCKHTH